MENIYNNKKESLGFHRKMRIEQAMIRKGIYENNKLLELMYNEFSDDSKFKKKPMVDFIDNNKGNISKYINSANDHSTISYEMAVALEKVLGTSIAYLDSNEKENDIQMNAVPYESRSLRHAAYADDVDEIRKLYEEKVLFNYDEHQKGIMDYIIEFNSVKCFQFIKSEYKICISLYGGIEACRTIEREATLIYSESEIYENAAEEISDGIQRQEVRRSLFYKDDDNKKFMLFLCRNNESEILMDYIEKAIFKEIEIHGQFYFERYIRRPCLYEENILYAFIENNELINDICNNYFSREMPFNKINYYSINRKKEENANVIFVNPIIDPLVRLAIKDKIKYKNILLTLIKKGIEHNAKMIKLVDELFYPYAKENEKIYYKDGLVVTSQIEHGEICYGSITYIENFITEENCSEDMREISAGIEFLEKQKNILFTKHIEDKTEERLRKAILTLAPKFSGYYSDSDRETANRYCELKNGFVEFVFDWIMESLYIPSEAYKKIEQALEAYEATPREAQMLPDGLINMMKSRIKELNNCYENIDTFEENDEFQYTRKYSAYKFVEVVMELYADKIQKSDIEKREETLDE